MTTLLKKGEATTRHTIHGSSTPLRQPEQLPKAPDQSACENRPPWIKVEGPKGQRLTSHKKGQSTPRAHLSFHYCCHIVLFDFPVKRKED